MFIKNASLFSDERFDENFFFEQSLIRELFSEPKLKTVVLCIESSIESQKCLSTALRNFFGRISFSVKT